MEPTVAQNPNPPTTPSVIAEHIAIKAGYCGGKPQINGHRIKVSHVVVWHDHMGMTPTEIATNWPTISLADVHAALAYYYDHRAQIDAEISADEELAAETEEKHSLFDSEGKLRRRTADVRFVQPPP
jgi:uncharacterized protein (DUF433 family)